MKDTWRPLPLQSSFRVVLPDCFSVQPSGCAMKLIFFLRYWPQKVSSSKFLETALVSTKPRATDLDTTHTLQPS